MTGSKRSRLSLCLVILLMGAALQETVRPQDRDVPELGPAGEEGARLRSRQVPELSAPDEKPPGSQDREVPELSAAGAGYAPPPGPLRFTTPAPAEFTTQDAAHLAQTTQKLREMQNQFLTTDLSRAELEKLAAQARVFVTTIQRLAEQRDKWQSYLEGREPAAGMPEMVATDLTPAVVDVEGFHKLVQTWMGFYRRHMGFESAGRDPTPPSATEWKRLAGQLQLYSRMRITTTPDGNARYVFRALLLEARCHLIASTLYFKQGDAPNQLDSYLAGLEILEWLAQLLRPGAAVQDLEVHETLPEAPYPYQGCELYGCDDSSLYPRLRQIKTGDKAKELLADYCPWGVQTFLAWRAMGLTEGLDWRILVPYGYSDPQYVGESPLRGPVPPHIQADMDAFCRGRFVHHGKDISIAWERPPGVTYSVWYISPLVAKMEGAPLAEGAARVVKVLSGQILLPLIGEGVDLLIDVFAGEYDAAEPIYAATGTAEDQGRYELAEEKYFLRAGVSTVAKLATDLPQGLLEYGERQEIENLFDGVNPNDPTMRTVFGSPKTYDGRFLPPVLIRADAMGWEKLSASQYRRQWHYVRYYRYDERVLSGLAEYDLSRHAVDRLPRLPDYLAAAGQVQKDTWKPAPGKTRANDARLYVTDLAPKTQLLRLSIPADVVQDWSRGLRANETLVATIMPLGVADSETVMGELNADGGSSLSYALMAHQAKRDETLLRVMPAANAWRQRLYAWYQVRVLRCPQGRLVEGRMVYRLDDPGAVEQARFEVRFAPRLGAPATGKRSYTLAGRSYPGLVILDQVYQGEAPRRPAPVAAEGPLLEQRLDVTLNSRTGVITLVQGLDTAGLKATVTPVEPGLHHLTVEAQGRVYHLWCRVEALSSSAVFVANLPLPPGRQDMTIRYKNLASTITVERPGESADTSGPQAQIRRAQEGRARARTAEQQSLQQALYWDGHRWLAQELHRAGRYAQALETLRQVLKNIPPDRLKGSGLAADKWREAYRGAAKQMVQTALFAADQPAYTQAAPPCLQAWTDHWMEQEQRRRPELRQDPRQFAAQRADDCAEVIRGAILVGASRETIEKLLAQYFEWRRKAGATMLQYDKNQFCYGPEKTGP